MNVDGTNAVLNTTSLAIGSNGYAGTGTLNISNGGLVQSSGVGLIGNASNASYAANSIGTVNVSSNSRWNLVNGTGAAQNLTVGQNGTGTLNINTTGSVTAGNTIIGNAVTTGIGTVNVGGLDAILNTTGLTVGQSGTGTLTITDSGVVNSAGTGNIGNAANSTGTVELGSAGQWNLVNGTGAAQNLTVGGNGTGTLNVHTTGTVTAGNTTIGSGATGVGNATVDGSGSVLNAAVLTVGGNGQGALDVTGGGTVNTSSYVLIGNSINTGVGEVTVNGANSVLNANGSPSASWGSLYVGNTGTGTLVIADSGVVNSTLSGVVGNAAGSQGEIDVSGGGQLNLKNTVTDALQSLTVGSNGTGILTIHDAGTVTAGNTTISSGATGVGTVTVDGSGSVLNTADMTIGAAHQGMMTVTNSGAVNTGAMSVGGINNGQGTLTITNDGVITSTSSVLLGVRSGSTGTADVSNGGTWNLVNASGALQALAVGQGGTGTLNIHADGTVTAGATTIGVNYYGMGTGTVNVDGANATLNTTSLTVGDTGTSGTLVISDAGVVTGTSAGTIGQGAASTGTVEVGSHSRWNLVNDSGEAQNLTVGGNGTGTLNVHTTGTVTAGNTTISSGATGVGNATVDGIDAVLNAGILTVGGRGTGTLAITDSGMVNSASNTIGTNAGSHGTVTIDGTGSTLADTGAMTVGGAGTGTITLSNGGTLAMTGGDAITIASNAGSIGVLNIGAADGEAATAAGYVTGTDSIVFGAGTGSIVFNHTVTDPATAGGYQFTPVISGNGNVTQDAGHTVFTQENTYSGTTSINGGTLTIATVSSTGNTGLGTSAVNIAQAGTLQIDGVSGATTDGAGNYTFNNALTGTGLITESMTGGDKVFSFGSSTGSDFAGVANLGSSTFNLSGDNTAALTNAVLQTSTGNTVNVGTDTQTIGGLAFNGGQMNFNVAVPADKTADGIIQTGKLIVGAISYTQGGNTYTASGTGKAGIDLPTGYVPSIDDTRKTNLLMHDDQNVLAKLVSADTVVGTAGGLTLVDRSTGNVLDTAQTVAINQPDGVHVADGTYNYRLVTAPDGMTQDGLYVNYGLTTINILDGKTLTLAEDAGATGLAADMSAQITGTGNLAVAAGDGSVSLSNGTNTYSGTTEAQSGTFITAANNVLGKTSDLIIDTGATVSIESTTQSVGALDTLDGAKLDIGTGTLNITASQREAGNTNGGLVMADSLSGAGTLNIDQSITGINGANTGFMSTVNLSGGSTVVMNNVQGLGSSTVNLATGSDTLVLGELSNNPNLSSPVATGVVPDGTLTSTVAGLGTVSLRDGAVVTLANDNSGFSGKWDIRSDSVLEASVQNQLGAATIADNGTLKINTATDWTLGNAVTGTGMLDKNGAGALTLTSASSQYTGVTNVNEGTLMLGTEMAPVNLSSTEVNVAGNANFGGFGGTSGDINNKGIFQIGSATAQNAVTTFNVGGNLTNSGSIVLGSGSLVGNTLNVAGDYTGNDGIVRLNTVLGGDSSVTDKLHVTGNVTGTSTLLINNIGGTGEQTVNGIQVVQVDGVSDAKSPDGKSPVAGANFKLGNSVKAGAYEYILQSRGEDWYLVNYLTDGAIYRPEVSNYVSGQRINTETGMLQLSSLHQRVGEHRTLPLEKQSWAKMYYSHQSEDGSHRFGYDMNLYGLQLGQEILTRETGDGGNMRAAVSFDYARADANMNDRMRAIEEGLNRETGNLRSDSWSLGGYVTKTYKNGAYVDIVGQLSWLKNRYDTENRDGSREGSKQTGWRVGVSAEGGYPLWKKAQWLLEGQGQLSYQYTDYRGNADVDSYGADMLRGRLGLRLVKTEQLKDNRTLEIYGLANIVHDFLNEEGVAIKDRSGRNVKVSESYGSTWGEIGLGIQGWVSKSTSVFGDIRYQHGFTSPSNGDARQGGMLNIGIRHSF